MLIMEILRINDIEFSGKLPLVSKVYHLGRLYNVHHISRHYNSWGKKTADDRRLTTQNCVTIAWGWDI